MATGALSVAISVLFVCLGNICRSPLTEAAFRREAERRGLAANVDSAGTGTWNLGEPPDPRAQAIAAREGFDISHRRARLVTAEDFARFDHVVALDAQNLRDLKAMRPAGAIARLSLLLDHVSGRGERRWLIRTKAMRPGSIQLGRRRGRGAGIGKAASAKQLLPRVGRGLFRWVRGQSVNSVGRS